MSGFLIGNGFKAFWLSGGRLLYRSVSGAWEDRRNAVLATTFTLASTGRCWRRNEEEAGEEEDETRKLRNVAEEGCEHLGGGFSCGVGRLVAGCSKDENEPSN